MRRLSRNLVLGTLFGGLALAAVTGWAKDGYGMHGDPARMVAQMADKLDLSGEQQAAIEAIEDHGNENRDCGLFEMAIHRGKNGEESAEQRCCREEIRKQVNAAASVFIVDTDIITTSGTRLRTLSCRQ